MHLFGWQIKRDRRHMARGTEMREAFMELLPNYFTGGCAKML